MALVEINWNPDSKDLRNFGRIGVIASVVIAALLHLIKGLAIKWCLVIFAVGLAIFICSVISIKATKWIYLALTSVAFPIGMVISFIVMAIFYYVLLMSVGLIFRLIGYDPMRRKFDSNAESYWVRHRPCDDIKRYFHQF